MIVTQICFFANQKDIALAFEIETLLGEEGERRLTDVFARRGILIETVS